MVEMTTLEMEEDETDMEICSNCGNNEFRVYITTIIDDARLYCAKCGHDAGYN